ncbi:MAG: hypothetical protein A2X64_01950 [Ignavibacteria bacterium GWF2_33_9]|nr:MAG: hypothetical protein A2X64_01950 [Ignavibacteria bacterium GWF2_33_9]
MKKYFYIILIILYIPYLVNAQYFLLYDRNPDTYILTNNSDNLKISINKDGISKIIQNRIVYFYKFDEISFIENDSAKTFILYDYVNKPITQFILTQSIKLLDKNKRQIGDVTINGNEILLNFNSHLVNIQLNNYLKEATISSNKNKVQNVGLIWSSLFGGNSTDYLSSVKVDSEDNIIVSGSTNSLNFNNLLPNQSPTGSMDVVIAKFASNYQIKWIAKIGGSETDYIFNMEIDNSDKIWICGETKSSDFFVTSNAFQKKLSGNSDGYLISFDEFGKVQFSTLYGGSEYDALVDLTIDSTQNVWSTGRSTSSNLLTTTDAIDKTLNELYESPILEVRNNGTLLYSSFFGGTSSSTLTLADCIETSPNGEIIIAGYSNSKTLPTTTTSFQQFNNGGYDSFIATFNPNHIVKWCTYIGGNLADYGSSLTVDKNSEIYLLTFTTSTNLPIINTNLQNFNNGGTDLYLSKFDKNGILKNSSYFGGNANDGDDYNGLIYIFSFIQIDNFGNINFTFKTNSTNLPTKNPIFSATPLGNTDIFYAELTKNFELTTGSYFGGSNIDNIGNFRKINDSTLIICGSTISADYPILNSYKTNRDLKNYDGFIAVFGTNFVSPKKDTLAPKITSAENDICNIERKYYIKDLGDPISGIKSVLIYISDNCNINYSIDSDSCYIHITLINNQNIAHYRIEILDNEGNSKMIDDYLGPVKGNSISANPPDILQFAPVEFSQKSTNFVTLYNNSSTDIVLNNIKLMHNTNFSIPQSQLPIIIPAKDSAKVEIIFFPQFPIYQDVYNDTLIIEDICVNMEIPMHSELLPSVYASDSKCEVPLVFKSDTLNNSIQNSLILPDVVIINFNTPIEQAILIVYDILGRKVWSNKYQEKTMSIAIPRRIFNSNLYFITIQNQISIKTFNLYIEK